MRVNKPRRNAFMKWNNEISRGGRKAQHAIIPAIGTDGDIYPFIGLATELQARGYEVTIATHEHFAACAEAVGIGFVPLVSDIETDELLRQRDFWHPLNGPVVVAHWGAKLVQRQYDVLSKLASRSGAFIVASAGVVAARIIQEKRGT